MKIPNSNDMIYVMSLWANRNFDVKSGCLPVVGEGGIYQTIPIRTSKRDTK